MKINGRDHVGNHVTPKEQADKHPAYTAESLR